MKHLFLIPIMTLIIMCGSYINVFAASGAAPVTNFQITGGIETGIDLQVTFDTYRTITGISDEGTVIVIKVFNEVNNELIKVVSYENTVGASQIFSQDIPLNVADNIIEITATKDNMETIITTTVRRMGLEIKHEIEGQSIVLPGRSII